MSIQSNINQGLSLMSLLASQTPAASARKEEAIRKKDIELTERRLANAQETENIALKDYEKLLSNEKITDEEIMKSAEAKLYNEAGSRVQSIQEELMAKDPTAERQKAILAREKETSNERERVELAKSAAQEKLKLEQERIAASRAITEGISYSPETTAYIKQRQKGGAK